MNLYEINDQILNCVDMETGEIIDEQKIGELQIAFDAKVENIGCWIKNLAAEAKAIKEEKEKLAARQKICENKAASLKDYLKKALNGEKFKTAKVSISYRKSKTVEVDDFKKLDDDYLNFKEPEVNKTKIKESINQGIAVPGAKLIENKNIQIR